MGITDVIGGIFYCIIIFYLMSLIKWDRIKKLVFYMTKYYRPIDNSYAECLDGSGNHYLAGTYSTPAEITEVIGEPYIKEITHGSRVDRHEFVKVKCKNGLTHEVLFYPGGLIK